MLQKVRLLNSCSVVAKSALEGGEYTIIGRLAVSKFPQPPRFLLKKSCRPVSTAPRRRNTWSCGMHEHENFQSFRLFIGAQVPTQPQEKVSNAPVKRRYVWRELHNSTMGRNADKMDHHSGVLASPLPPTPVTRRNWWHHGLPSDQQSQLLKACCRDGVTI